MDMKEYKVGVIGCTGMVGQRFITLLEHHPWFRLTAVGCQQPQRRQPLPGGRGGRWALDTPMPEAAGDLVVLGAEADAEKLANMVDFCFAPWT